MTRIRIAPAPPPPADYDVVVEPGALDQLPTLLAEAAPAFRYVIIADATVASHYGERVRGGLEDAGLRVSMATFPAGEEHKTRESWAALTDALLADEVGRDGAVIALGGGVVGDLAGFVAATYMRGLPFVQVPTSLLAMVDASVGGKTGVDTPAGKNLVGAFHQPRLVVSDPQLLRTLPERELRSGLAEAVKHGAIADRDYLEWIGGAAGPLLSRDAEALARLVRRSVEIKADFVSADPLETGARKALNFGHTIGHAVEALAGYRIPHGYAVAVGLVAEALAGEDAGVTEAGTAELLSRVLRSFGLPVAPPAGLEPEAIVALTRRDKKARQAHARYTLLARPGEVARTAAGDWTFPLDEQRVAALLGRLTA